MSIQARGVRFSWFAQKIEPICTNSLLTSTCVSMHIKQVNMIHLNNIAAYVYVHLLSFVHGLVYISVMVSWPQGSEEQAVLWCSPQSPAWSLYGVISFVMCTSWGFAADVGRVECFNILTFFEVSVFYCVPGGTQWEHLTCVFSQDLQLEELKQQVSTLKCQNEQLQTAVTQQASQIQQHKDQYNLLKVQLGECLSHSVLRS